MKKGILYSSLFGFGLVLLSVVILSKEGDNQYYTPRQVANAEDGINGAAQWLHSIRANQVTGEISAEDVMKGRMQVLEAAKNRKSSSALDLGWESMGPNNVGGRTRSFLIDQNDPNIMFAGAVSGGLFKSTNGGSSWAPVNDMQENLAVVSIEQAPNGDIYYGTGEGMYYNATGTGTGGIAGGGMFRSTDGGNTFTLVSSTAPQPNGEWRAIGKIEIDPNNSNLIYAATQRGLRVSTDGGASWESPIGFGAALDMTMDSSGRVWVKQGSSIYKSDGTPNNFTEISTSGGTIPQLPRMAGRSRIAVAPQDDNYVYIIETRPQGFNDPLSENFEAAYRSTDGGSTWEIIGQRSMYLNPHSGGSQGQGTFDNAVTVDPKDKDRIFVGGVTFYEWTQTGGWQLAASIAGANIGFSFYVHADMHNVVFHPTDPNIIYALNDGGIFRSKDNGDSWAPISKGYVSSQFYSIGVGLNGELMGGTQDNGTIFIDPSNFIPESGVRTPGVSFLGAVRDGDGGFAELSKLNSDIRFKEMQYGILGRSTDGGDSYESIYDFDRMDPTGVAGNGSNAFAGFVMPFLLWEKLNDPKSEDSLTFSADSLIQNFGFGGGDSVFSGTFAAPAFFKTTVNGDVINTTANLLWEEFETSVDTIRVFVNTATGDLECNFPSLLNDGGSFINYYLDTTNNNIPTVDYRISFSKAIGNDRVIAGAPISYSAGDKVILKSETNDIDIIYELPTALNSTTNPSIRVQDHVQSMFFVGLTGRNLNTPSGNPNDAGGIWMTRSSLTTLVGDPQWFHIGDIGNGEEPQSMAVSGDGDILFVGTSRGRIYRFSNISNARDSASADIDDFYKSSSNQRPSTSVIQKTVVATYSGRAVTSIATHPFDNNKIVVTLGNYGNDDYVYYSGNAASANPTLIQKDLASSNLPDIPVYASTFNYNDPNGGEVLIGTDYGVYTVDDITASGVSWTAENTGLANVPVFDLIQQLTVRYDLKPLNDFEGAIYAGTHGRGIFKTSSSSVVDYIGEEEHEVVEINNVKVLDVYPNPASERINVNLSLEGRTDVEINITNINGQVVKNVKYSGLSGDVESLEIEVNNLANGSYIITLQKGKEVITGKFIKK